MSDLEQNKQSPHVGSGKVGFAAYFDRMATKFPGKRVHLKRAVAEKNLGGLHCHQIWPDGLEYAGHEIFRLNEHGKITEHREVLQQMPTPSAHTNGIF